ncbi:MAG: hypothetical protein FIB08_09900 [Candidatus Methanoperedens sp.]|nr:hypothetical protein [Candidatus Methanoperedens sp.]
MPERNNFIFTSRSTKTGIILITILFAMIISVNAASAANESIKVATNRYIVLDDPQVTGATATGTGFGLPANDWGTTNNRWTGKQTTVGVQALYMDGNGTPLAGRTINFALFYPNGTASGITGTDVTDSQGLASFYGNVDNRRAYGQWRVKADIGSVSSNTTFIYNWWGCAYSSGGCNNQHSGKNPGNRGNAPANSPYTISWEKITSERTDHNTDISTNGWADDYCTVCHNGYDGQPTSSTPGTKDFYTVDTHQSIRCDNSACHNPGTSYANHNAGTITIGSCNGCHTRTDITDKSTLNGVVSNYSNSTAGAYDKYHTPTSTVPCIVCHGPMHNITKPDASQRFIKNDVTEDSQCKACHADYNKHSGSVNCTLCHSDDVHAIQVFSQSAGYVNHGSSNQGNCTSCHQNSTFLNTLKAQPKAGSYSGPDAPQIKKPMNHSDDPLAGTKWGSHWTSQQTACIYCHSSTLHDLSPLGRILQFAPGYQMYGTIGTNTSCASCHYKGDSNYTQMSSAFTSAGLLLPPEITNGTNWKGISTGYYNHSFATSQEYQDQNCKACHGSLLSIGANMGEFQHNTGIGKAGNPDCVSCHDISGGQAKVDVANIKASIHLNLNNGGNAGSYNVDNKICWACHTNSTVSGDGKVDASEIPASSHPDSYNVPRKCTQCHTGGGNFNALIVSEHNSAGTDIRTKPQADTNTSCVNCHMKSEMITTNSDPGGPKSNIANVSHYGSNKTGVSPYNIGGVSNCALCHQGSSAFSSEMVNAAWNASISNHSTNYPSTNPGCANCHSTGRIHDSTLTKPAFSLPNSAYCLTCHNSTGSATLKNKEQHNGTVDCTKCHVNTNKNIHPVQYLEQGGMTFATTKTNAVNCTNCHQVKLANFTSAPIIPDTLKHSSSLSNGTLWGTFWISESGSCFYCHSDTRHNTTALGRINNLLLDPSNTRNGAITNTQWCADCHYNDPANTNYRGNQLSPVPPAITVDNTGGVPGWVNHSGYLTTGYKDSVCETCHALNGTTSKTSLNYSHSLNVGTAGGANCVSCHDISGTAPKHVDSAVLQNSIHSNLNGASTDINKACYACHGDGTAPSGHPANYKSPKLCTDCHTDGNFSALIVSEHNSGGMDLKTKQYTNINDSCINCHVKPEMIRSNSDPEVPSSGYANVSHYGDKKGADQKYVKGGSANCTLCHQGSSVFSTEMVDAAWNASISNHSTNYASTNPDCADCHSTGRIHNSTLAKPALSLPSSAYCLTCHNSTGSATLKNKEQHNGTVDCTKCHLSTNKNIHPVQYLEQGGATFATTKTNAVNCTNCHQTQLSGFGNAPIIPNPLKHSSSLSNGTLWGTFWTSESGSCFYCHSDTRHNTTALGRINNLLLDPSNTRNGAITNTQWCADCHYNDPANTNYRGNQLSPVPPAITVDNTGVPGWVDHTGYLTAGYKDNVCETCHAQLGAYSKTSLNYSHSLNVGAAGGANCVACHDVGGSAPKLVNVASIQNGIHKGLNNATADINKACYACHSDGTPPASGHPANYKNPKLCTDCHTDGNFTAPIIQDHKPPKLDMNPGRAGTEITAGVYCSVCHINSNNNISSTQNATVSHYGTNSSLLKPTVNQTTMPRFGFFTLADASANNKECANCHNPSNSSYGNATFMSNAHTPTGTCVQCHVDGDADNLHNGSLGMPVTFQCKDCHTTKADQYKAPNLTGTSHVSLTCGSGAACHIPGGQFDNRNMHNWSFNYAGTPPATPTVYLNGVAATLTVTQGTPVTITSTINDASGLASRVRGAEYFIGQNPGSDPNLYGKGNQMNAADGVFNAASEPVTASISGLSEGTYTIYVRGMDIGKQWSSSGVATLTVTAPKGFINGTVKNGSIAGELVPGVTVTAGTVSAVTDGSGNYSLSLPTGTYTLNATKNPEFNAISIPNVGVTAPGTTQQDIFIIKKATGTITGVVTS